MALVDVVERVARCYRSKCWWADIDDLRQQAWEACIRAERTWEAEVGVPLDAYAWTAAWRSVGRYLLNNSSPVSASWGQVGNLARLLPAPVDEDDVDPAPWADAVLSDKHWRERVRSHALRVLCEGGMSEFDQQLALEVLAIGFTAAEVAVAHSVPIAQVKRARRRAATLVLQDLQCYRYWRGLQT